MGIDPITDDELDEIWGATEDTADMEREKFRKACADFGKAIAEKIKPMAKSINELMLRIAFKPRQSWHRHPWRWVMRLFRRR